MKESPLNSTGKEIEVGGIYQYKEDHHIAQIKILADKSDDEGESYEVEVLDCLSGDFKKGHIFTPWQRYGQYGYNGMCRIYNDGEYVMFPIKEAIK